MGILTPPQPSAPDPIATAATAIIQGIISQFQAMADAQQAGYNALFADQTKTLALVAELANQGLTLPMLLGSAQIAIQSVQAAATLDGGTAPTMPTLAPGWTLTMDSTGQIPIALVPPPATPPTGLTATFTSPVVVTVNEDQTTTVTQPPGAAIAWQSVVGALSYWLEKSVDGTTWATISSGQHQPGTTHTDAAGMTSNQYRVRSCTAAGYSDYSATVTL